MNLIKRKTSLLLLALIAVMSSSCKFTEAPSAGLAKEMCSCLFVAEQTEPYCRMVTKESRILADWEADFNRKEVTARGANFMAMAKMDSDPRYGCSIKVVKLDDEAYSRMDQHRGGR